MRHVAALVALFCAGCASMPDMQREGFGLGKSNWRMAGGADFDKKVWFVTFWRPWGAAETQAAIDADKIVIP